METAADPHRQPAKPPEAQQALADNIRQLNPDVLAVEEIADEPTLRRFIASYLPDMGYRYVTVRHGNDQRGINVGVMSRLPLTDVQDLADLPVYLPGHPEPQKLSRSLLQATVQAAPGYQFDLFVTHLKALTIGNPHEVGRGRGDSHPLVPGPVRRQPSRCPVRADGPGSQRGLGSLPHELPYNPDRSQIRSQRP